MAKVGQEVETLKRRGWVSFHGQSMGEGGKLLQEGGPRRFTDGLAEREDSQVSAYMDALYSG